MEIQNSYTQHIRWTYKIFRVLVGVAMTGESPRVVLFHLVHHSSYVARTGALLEIILTTRNLINARYRVCS